MKVTIIPADNLVIIDGAAVTVNCSAVNPNYHAIHWDETAGEIQTKRGENLKITNLASFQSLIDQATELIEEGSQPATLEQVKADKKAMVDALYEEKAGIGFEFPPSSGMRVQVRDRDIGRITAMALMADKAERNEILWPEGFFWRMADNTTWPVQTPEQMTLLSLAAQQAVYGLFLVSAGHKDAIAALPTIGEVAAYDITTGWPT